jgi:hypothetical protein
LRPALEDIIDLRHPLVRLAREIDWRFLDGRFASVCAASVGQPPLPTRLVAGLFILKHMHDLSDEVLCARWLENPYWPCHGNYRRAERGKGKSGLCRCDGILPMRRRFGSEGPQR